MTIEKLKRIMWRIRSRNKDKVYITRHEVEKAIFLEAGIWPETVRYNRQALIKLGWLKTRKQKYEITDKDLTES